MPLRKTAPKQVRVLQKTLDILEAIKNERFGTGLADVARRVGMPKATVYRILTTLEINGYLDRQVDGGYRLSQKLFSLQRPILAQDLPRVALPIMEAIAEECQETVNLGVLDGGEVVVVATVESQQSIRMASKVGNRRCFHTTGLGKALLTSLPDESIHRLVKVKGLPRLTPGSITSLSALLAEIRQVRKQGYAIDDQENELDGRCIGMHIAGIAEPPVALSISGPVFRIDMRRLKSFFPLLLRGCREIATALDR